MLSETERKQYESEKARVAREDVLYDELEETNDICVADGFVSYTKHFKYLGSYIHTIYVMISTLKRGLPKRQHRWEL